MKKCYWDPFYNSCYVYVPSSRSSAYFPSISSDHPQESATRTSESIHSHTYTIVVLILCASIVITPFHVVVDWVGTSFLWTKTNSDRLKFLKNIKAVLVNTKGRVGRVSISKNSANKVRPIDENDSAISKVPLSLGTELRRLFIFVHNYGDLLEAEDRETFFTFIFATATKTAAPQRRVATRLTINKVRPVRGPVIGRNSIIRSKTENEWKNITAGSHIGNDTNITSTISENSMNFTQRVVSNVKCFIKQVAVEQKLMTTKTVLQQKLRLLFLFQYDLLPPLSKRILESKYMRDNPNRRAISEFTKLLIVVLLLAINIAILSAILAWSYQNDYTNNSETNNSNDLQRLLIECFIAWMVLEPLVISIFNVILIHILLPLTIISDIRKIRQVISKTILNYRAAERKRNKDNLMKNGLTAITSANTDNVSRNDDDMAKIFFFSKQIADCYPSFMESKIILSYSSDITARKRQIDNIDTDLKNMMHHVGIIQNNNIGIKSSTTSSKLYELFQLIYLRLGLYSYQLILFCFDQNILIQNIGAQILSIVVGKFTFIIITIIISSPLILIRTDYSSFAYGIISQGNGCCHFAFITIFNINSNDSILLL